MCGKNINLNIVFYILYLPLVFIIVSLSETSHFFLIERTPAVHFWLSLLFSFALRNISKDHLPNYILKLASSAFEWTATLKRSGQSVQNLCLRFLIYDLYKDYASFRKTSYIKCELPHYLRNWPEIAQEERYMSSMTKYSDKTQEPIRNCTEVLDFKSNFY